MQFRTHVEQDFWMQVWLSVSSSSSCTETRVATDWADRAVEALRERSKQLEAEQGKR